MSKPQFTTPDDTHTTDHYQAVLDAVAEATSEDEPLTSHAPVLQRAVDPETGIDSDAVHRLTAEAIDNDDLLSWHGKLACTDTESLRAVVRAEADSEYPHRPLIGRCNELMQEADQ